MKVVQPTHSTNFGNRPRSLARMISLWQRMSQEYDIHRPQANLNKASFPHRWSVQKSALKRYSGRGFGKIRDSIQTKCSCGSSVIKISDQSVAVDAVAERIVEDQQATAYCVSYRSQGHSAQAQENASYLVQAVTVDDHPVRQLGDGELKVLQGREVDEEASLNVEKTGHRASLTRYIEILVVLGPDAQSLEISPQSVRNP